MQDAVQRQAAGLYTDHVHADGADRNADHSLVSDERAAQVAQYLLVGHVSGPDHSLWHGRASFIDRTGYENLSKGKSGLIP